MRPKILPPLIIGLVLATSSTKTALATWPTDPTLNLPLATVLYSREFPRLVWDGADAVIVVWQEFRDVATDWDIYAQRVSLDGDTLWAIHGIPITTAPSIQKLPQVVTDEAFGAIIAWEDARTPGWDVYAQRVDPQGNLVWTSDVAICTASGGQNEIEMVADGEGGAVIVWMDYRAGALPDIYAQRVDPDGNVLWAADGVPVCTATGEQQNPAIVRHAGGAVTIVWEDERGSTNDIYAQRLDANGDSVWAANGVAVCTAARDQREAVLTTDLSGGVLIAWSDNRPVTADDIYAQRIDAAGDTLWQADGVGVCTDADDQDSPAILPDGVGGAFICWDDDRGDFNLYANRIDSSGNILWATNGLPVCEAENVSTNQRIVPDGQGGVIIAWEDTRSASPHQDIFAQRVSANGDVLWTQDGVPVTTAMFRQLKLDMVTDGRGGAVVVWEDYRNGGVLAQRYRIYAQRIDSTGTLSTPTALPEPKPQRSTLLELRPNFPNPFGEGTLLRFELSRRSDVFLAVYDVQGREVFAQSLRRRPAGANHYFFDGRDAAGRRLPTGIYFARISAGGYTQSQKLVITR